MKYTHLLASFCTLTIISTHPLIDHEHESPIEVREAAAAPAALASTNPFPSQKDGVLADGTVINSTPNVDTLNNSCWTTPNKPLYAPSDPEFKNNMCQICVIQSGLGPKAWYEAWVRDANNRATGSLSAIELGPGTAAGKMYTFSAALKDLTIGVTPNASPSEASAVTMMWGDAVETQQMYFNAATKMGGTNCTFSNDAHGGTMTYFQCTFGCGLPFQRMA